MDSMERWRAWCIDNGLDPDETETLARAFWGGVDERVSQSVINRQHDTLLMQQAMRRWDCEQFGNFDMEMLEELERLERDPIYQEACRQALAANIRSQILPIEETISDEAQERIWKQRREDAEMLGLDMDAVNELERLEREQRGS